MRICQYKHVLKILSSTRCEKRRKAEGRRKKMTFDRVTRDKLKLNHLRKSVSIIRRRLRTGNDITSAYPPNAGKNLPWRIQLKSRPPLWRVRTLGSPKEADHMILKTWKQELDSFSFLRRS